MAQHQHNPWDEKMADWYVEQWGEHAIHDAVMSLPTLKRLTHAKVVDVGCGSGPMVRRLAQKLRSGTVYGVDPTPRMIEYAQSLTPSYPHVTVGFEQTGAAQLPFETGSIDVVLALNSLHHWPDVAEGLKEIHRIMDHDATLLIVDEIFDDVCDQHKPNQELEQQRHAHITAYKQPNNIIKALSQAHFIKIEHQIMQQAGINLHVICAHRQ